MVFWKKDKDSIIQDKKDINNMQNKEDINNKVDSKEDDCDPLHVSELRDATFVDKHIAHFYYIRPVLKSLRNKLVTYANKTARIHSVQIHYNDIKLNGFIACYKSYKDLRKASYSPLVIFRQKKNDPDPKPDEPCYLMHVSSIEIVDPMSISVCLEVMDLDKDDAMPMTYDYINPYDVSMGYAQSKITNSKFIYGQMNLVEYLESILDFRTESSLNIAIGCGAYEYLKDNL